MYIVMYKIVDINKSDAFLKSVRIYLHPFVFSCLTLSQTSPSFYESEVQVF